MATQLIVASDSVGSRAVGDFVRVVAEQPLHTGKYRRADRVEFFDARGQGIEAPVGEKGFGTVCCALAPKQAELFLHGMEDEQGLIGRQQIIEAPLFVIGQFMVIAQQEEPAALQGFGAFVIEAMLLLTTLGVDLAVDQGHDMIAVKDDGHIREIFFDRTGVTGAHVYGHGFELFGFFRHGPEKRGYGIFTGSLNGMQDATGEKVDKDGHVGMPLAQTELVDAKIPDCTQINGPVFRGKPIFMNLLDKIPTDRRWLPH